METANYNAFYYGIAFVVGLLMLMAWLGMSGGPRHTSRRPPSHPPGWKNVRTTKRKVTYGPANGVTRGEQHRRRSALVQKSRARK